LGKKYVGFSSKQRRLFEDFFFSETEPFKRQGYKYIETE